MERSHPWATLVSDVVLTGVVGWMVWLSQIETVVRPVEIIIGAPGALLLLGLRIYIAIQDARVARHKVTEAERAARQQRGA